MSHLHASPTLFYAHFVCTLTQSLRFLTHYYLCLEHRHFQLILQDFRPRVCPTLPPSRRYICIHAAQFWTITAKFIKMSRSKFFIFSAKLHILLSPTSLRVQKDLLQILLPPHAKTLNIRKIQQKQLLQTHHCQVCWLSNVQQMRKRVQARTPQQVSRHPSYRLSLYY